MQSVIVCLREMFDGELYLISERDCVKIVLLQVKGLIQIIVKFRTKKNCARFYHPPNILLMRGTYCAPNIV